MHEVGHGYDRHVASLLSLSVVEVRVNRYLNGASHDRDMYAVKK
jgi:hypothetical protein